MIFPADTLQAGIEKLQAALNSQVSRKNSFAKQVVIVDGNEGCGKTLFGPIISTFKRLELLSYSYEIEYICSLHNLGKIQTDAAVALVNMFADLKIYNTMMGRDTNFRFSDLSSAFQDSNPWRYFIRIFQKGDEIIPKRISKENPILQLTTHNLLGIGEPVFSALNDRLTFIEIVRHPLYKIKQQQFDMQRILGSARDFRIYLDYQGHEVPHWTKGWEKLFFESNETDKVIHSINHFTRITQKAKESFKQKFSSQIITIPFERFVVSPWPYLDQIEGALKTTVTPLTCKMLKKQNVPRKMYAQGIGLSIYKRCGWKPPQSNDENQEFEIRWSEVAKTASLEGLKILEKLCLDYEDMYLNGKKDYKRQYERD